MYTLFDFLFPVNVMYTQSHYINKKRRASGQNTGQI